jgi:hypothetical protein
MLEKEVDGDGIKMENISEILIHNMNTSMMRILEMTFKVMFYVIIFILLKKISYE